jgi:hypothetical protein
MTILHQQPRLIPPPVLELQNERSTSHEWLARTKSFASRASTRGSFSVRRKLNAYNGPRRPRISGPTEFRHVEMALPRRRHSFRPLELSIYMPENKLLPISVPHLEDLYANQQADSAEAPVHARSDSSLSNFTIPRKPLGGYKSVHARLEGVSDNPTVAKWLCHRSDSLPAPPKSPSTQELMATLEKELPQLPPKERVRSYTEPVPIIAKDSVHVDRVRMILREKVELEKRLRDLDIIIEERRSVYLRSRANSVKSEGTLFRRKGLA